MEILINDKIQIGDLVNVNGKYFCRGNKAYMQYGIVVEFPEQEVLPKNSVVKINFGSWKQDVDVDQISIVSRIQ